MGRGNSSVTGGIVRAIACRAIVASISIIGGACSDSSSNTAAPIAADITASSTTNGQTGVAGAALAQAVAVHVTDQSGTPVANATVTWTVAARSGSVASTTSETDASGDANVVWTVGTAAGTDTLTASIGSGATAIITASVTAAAPSALRVTSASTQSVPAGSATAPLVVQLIDQFANPIANAAVTWSVSGGGTLSATTATTDASGLAQVTLTTDSAPATYVVSASAGNISAVTFTITGM
jgi:adhesin/invasin